MRTGLGLQPDMSASVRLIYQQVSPQSLGAGENRCTLGVSLSTGPWNPCTLGGLLASAPYASSASYSSRGTSVRKNPTNSSAGSAQSVRIHSVVASDASIAKRSIW